MTIISLCMFQTLTEKAEIEAFTRKILVLQKNSKKPFLKIIMWSHWDKIESYWEKIKKIQQLQPLLLLLDTGFS